MSLEIIRDFLGWCSLINFGLLLYWFLMFIFAHDFIYKLNSRWFPMSNECFNTIHYAAMAFYKLSIILFFFVPYVVLQIILV